MSILVPKSACLSEHEFVLVLAGIAEVTESVENALFEAGCDDCTISMRSGRVYLAFERTDVSMREAVLSAIRDVRKSGLGPHLLRVDICNLVTQSDIARRTGRTRQQIHQYITGSRGPGGFPAPTCEITDGHPLYRWCEVSEWLWLNGMLKEAAFEAARDLDLINCILDWQRHQKDNPASTDEIFQALSILVEHPGSPEASEARAVRGR